MVYESHAVFAYLKCWSNIECFKSLERCNSENLHFRHSRIGKITLKPKE